MSSFSFKFLTLTKVLVPNTRNVSSKVSDVPVKVVETPWKKNYTWRYGYRDPLFKRPDTLPRLKSDIFLHRLPECEPKDKFPDKLKYFGQNDYIDILGDGSIHPVCLLTNMPAWLRGFRGNEFQMLLKQQKARYYYRWTKPTKWKWMNKRIMYLYKYLNRKTKT